MSIRIIIFVFFFAFHFTMNANDIVLKQFHGTRVHYNFFLDNNGSILIGTSEGTFQVTNDYLVKLNDNAGYVSLNNGELEVSKSGSVQRHYIYSDLLPKSYRKFWQQSIEKEEYTYVICRGSLFIYKTLSYTTEMAGFSVRAFSRNSVATYDGVFCFGEKIEVPTYSSGRILEIDSTFYICYDGLAKYKMGEESLVYSNEITGETKIGDSNIGFSRDIRKLNDGRFLLSTTNGLFVLNDSLDEAESIFYNQDDNAPIIIEVFQNGYTNKVTFASRNKIYNYGLNSKELIQLTSFSNHIVDGMVIPNEINSTYMILTDDSLIIYNYLSNSKKIIKGLKKAYSLLVLSNNNLLVSSIDGLFFLKSGTTKFVHILEGIEFNKMAVFKDNDTIKLGSTNGIIRIAESDLQKIAETEEKKVQTDKNRSLLNLVLVLLAISLVLLIFNWFRKKSIVISDKTEINKQTILSYIEENLNQVTIDSLTNNFKISNTVLYSLLAPIKPGKLITSLRLEKARELKIQGKSIDEIAKYTGFSISYLKKLEY